MWINTFGKAIAIDNFDQCSHIVSTHAIIEFEKVNPFANFDEHSHIMSPYTHEFVLYRSEHFFVKYSSV